MMETLQENQKNEYDDLYIAEFSKKKYVNYIFFYILTYLIWMHF